VKIIGIRPSSFKGSDGTQVSGQNIYMTYPLDKGDGLGAERVFVTGERLGTWLYRPKVGDEVEVNYNRYGKCTEIVQLGK